MALLIAAVSHWDSAYNDTAQAFSSSQFLLDVFDITMILSFNPASKSSVMPGGIRSRLKEGDLHGLLVVSHNNVSTQSVEPFD